MDLRLYNTLTRNTEVFAPLNPDRVTMYACGPTVYNYAHIGNARPPVLFGLLARLLKHRYGSSQVLYARNITDVDDKINAAASELDAPGLDINQKIAQITERFTNAYLIDMDALGAERPDLQPRATAHISQIITMCESLVRSGHAYVAAGHVLFAVEKYANYGELSRRSIKEMIAGARVEVAPYKLHPADFVLWKPSTDDIPGWPSPWGRGRPGWHIECSAMSEAHLGVTLDIHCGGNDLTFPHHENEIAQSTCAHGGAMFARFWMHNGMVTVDGRKMSKSLGNTMLASELRKHHDAEVLRFWLLGGHYRQPLDFSEAALHQARTTLDRLYAAVRELADVQPDAASIVLPQSVEAALSDDLNTPQALAELSGLVREAYKALGPQARTLAKARLLGAAGFLGLLQRSPQDWFQAASVGSPAADAWSDAQIDGLITQRLSARQNRDFALADALRKQLADAGIVLEDTAQGVRWKRG
jgi:cysteinyl-tRNA synthetase